MRAPWIDASDVSLIVADGAVELTGTVPERSMRDELEDLAADLNGVLGSRTGSACDADRAMA